MIFKISIKLFVAEHTHIAKQQKTRGQLKENISNRINMKKENLNTKVSNLRHFKCINILANSKS